MLADIRPLDTDADFDRLVDASHHDPVIVLKHSETCGASQMADERLAHASLGVPVHRVVVQRSRALSTRIAAALGVRHESPQVIVIAKGVATWHSSHSGVTPERVALALARARAALAEPVSV